MSLNEEVELLRNIPLFSKLEPSKLKLLAFTAERITYEPDQVLFKQGDVGDAAYIIVDGAAKVLVDTPDGELEVAALGRNDFVGEIAILCDVPRTATVRASAKTVTLRITKDLFFRLVAEFPEMSVEIMRELASRLEHTTQQLREALASNK
ncbi:MAG: cyclic nucleotide-binding domain-containing protein [Rhodospirillaceae bacterium]|nr:cyclic nucleotide-binding domain-containing protein [Rhodospirillaceae bacterium]MBT3810971.1 cyclic nucleotide-binding domain-containing protein [Rhodospirillaceae bacterium]MBT3930759.1 cyclic nucleotide-binding domain-containing protein [Rhodospirillaceae bacterium]MBT4773485.1 cyclic nucleotide-binding domain-containing protein [Rhodospirillaceae bacterium]MBT5358073.1 cyclic nucleotide-binding domain-containing protein [Rhodospirillaceae bacterium]